MAFHTGRAIDRRERAFSTPRHVIMVAAGSGACMLLLLTAWAVQRASEGAQSLALLGVSISVALVVAASGALWAARRARGKSGRRRTRAWPREREDATSIAHDLRAPLATVNSYLDLLAQEQFGPMPAAAREAARRAAHASSRLQAVVEATLLHEARVAAGEPRVAPGATPLDEVLGDVLASLSSRMEALDAAVHVGPLPAVRGDANQLFRVFQNLVENALKYHVPGDPPRVVISASVAQQRAEIVVRDWGIGIPQAERERVFRRRARGAHGAERAPGSGVGLANVRRLLEELDGAASIDPTITQGVAIRITLPLA